MGVDVVYLIDIYLLGTYQEHTCLRFLKLDDSAVSNLLRPSRLFESGTNGSYLHSPERAAIKYAPFPNGNLSAIAQTMKPMEASASTSLLFSIFSNSISLIPM